MKKDKKVPKLRLPGFTDDWEKRKLGEITQRVQGNDGRMDLPTLTISAGYGWLDQRDRFSANIAGKEQKNYTLLCKGELSYNHGNSKLAKYGTVFSLRTYEEALVPRVYHSFKVTNEADADFIEYIFATKLPDKELGKLISSGARMDGLLNINYEEFMGIKITMPSIEEQKQLSNYLRHLDNFITLHQRKCDALKELKKRMLQKMFPKAGEKVPEIRFPEFSGDWEQCKLGDIVKLNGRIGFRGYTEKDIISKEAGGILTFSPTNIVDNKITTDCKNTYITRYKYDESPEIEVHNGDILFVKAGFTLGKSALITGLSEEATLNPQVVVMRVKLGEEEFLSTALITDNILKQVNSAKIGGAVPTLTETKIKEFSISLPSSDEEKKQIGTYFCNLNNLITLHQRKCDEWKKLKKGLLQQMFV